MNPYAWGESRLMSFIGAALQFYYQNLVSLYTIRSQSNAFRGADWHPSANWVRCTTFFFVEVPRFLYGGFHAYHGSFQQFHGNFHESFKGSADGSTEKTNSAGDGTNRNTPALEGDPSNGRKRQSPSGGRRPCGPLLRRIRGTRTAPPSTRNALERGEPQQTQESLASSGTPASDRHRQNAGRQAGKQDG